MALGIYKQRILDPFVNRDGQAHVDSAHSRVGSTQDRVTDDTLRNDSCDRPDSEQGKLSDKDTLSNLLSWTVLRFDWSDIHQANPPRQS